MSLTTRRLDGLASRAPTMREIAAGVAAEYGVDLDVMLAAARRPSFTAPRHTAMDRIYATGRFSNLQVAQFFGLTHHTSVIHARQAVERRAAA